DQHLATGYASELAVFDCHACHHPMKPPRGQPEDFSAALPAGSLRLLDAPYDMVAAITTVVLPEQQTAWSDAVRALHRASNKSGQVKFAVGEITKQLQSLENSLRAA